MKPENIFIDIDGHIKLGNFWDSRIIIKGCKKLVKVKNFGSA